MRGIVKAFAVCGFLCWLAAFSRTALSDGEPSTGSQPLDDAQRRELLREAVADADKISNEQARQQAQWAMVGPLVQLGLRDEAFQQAMKLSSSNPQTCIYSLTTIAKDALAHGKPDDAQKAWDAARQANADSGRKHDHYLIELGFKLNRPLRELTAVASESGPSDRQRAFRDIRNELARRGRVDEAYAITTKHLPALPNDLNDREIAYYCSAANQFNEPVAHDHLGQAIRIIERMPKGEHRDAAIGQLIDGLLYASNKDKISPDRVALAEKWVGRIDDQIKQSSARAKILRIRLPALNVDELEQQFVAAASREERQACLRSIFAKLLEENRFDEADAILAREIEVIRAHPRPEVKSKFGNVADDDAVRIATWLHNRALVQALNKAGRRDEARARIESMKTLPDSEPIFLIGDLADIRLSLYIELEEFDAVEKIIAEMADPSRRAAATISMAAWMTQKGQFERGWKHVEPLMNQPTESLAPAAGTSLYFWAQPFDYLTRELLKANRTNDAVTLLRKIPESHDTVQAFETFGELLATSGRLADLEQWLLELPHPTARAHARLGALRVILAPPEDPH